MKAFIILNNTTFQCVVDYNFRIRKDPSYVL